MDPFIARSAQQVLDSEVVYSASRYIKYDYLYTIFDSRGLILNSIRPNKAVVMCESDILRLVFCAIKNNTVGVFSQLEFYMELDSETLSYAEFIDPIKRAAQFLALCDNNPSISKADMFSRYVDFSKYINAANINFMKLTREPFLKLPKKKDFLVLSYPDVYELELSVPLKSKKLFITPEPIPEFKNFQASEGFVNVRV